MSPPLNPSALTSILLLWYSKNKRAISWRNTDNPYFVWLSEVIMQQTRIEQGTPYLLRYIEKYPTLLELANAHEDEIMKMWQGLGYYTRARNLHIAAKQIRDEYDGKFPQKYKQIRALKGVGDYTAAAIASIAFNQAYAAVDGNVLRVLSRYYGEFTPINSSDGKKLYSKLATDVLSIDYPGEFNQAMMELGAIVCKPRQPLCNECPISISCIAFAKKLQEQLPIKTKKAKVVKLHLNYLVFTSQGKTLLRKRSIDNIWKGLYEFPLVEGELSEIEAVRHIRKWCMKSFTIKSISKEIKHLLSHREFRVKFYEIECDSISNQNNFSLIDWNEFEQYPVSKLIQYWRESKYF